jgi:hypothetical protein
VLKSTLTAGQNTQYSTIKEIFFLVALWPNAGHRLLSLEVSISHITTHHSRLDSSGRVISSSQRLLPDYTQHSQQTNIPALGSIRTHNLSRRGAADPCRRPRGHWDRPYGKLYTLESEYWSLRKQILISSSRLLLHMLTVIELAKSITEHRGRLSHSQSPHCNQSSARRIHSTFSIPFGSDPLPY